MGRGYEATCGKCKHDNQVFLGVGMMFPKVYQDLIEGIRKGEFGEEWRTLESDGEFVAVDARKRLFLCPECGGWEVEPSLSLYAPLDTEAVKEKMYGDRSLAERGYVPYVMSHELAREYRLIKEWVHVCPRCGSVMRESEGKSPEALGLGCHECGTRLKKWHPVHWD